MDAIRAVQARVANLEAQLGVTSPVAHQALLGGARANGAGSIISAAGASAWHATLTGQLAATGPPLNLRSPTASPTGARSVLTSPAELTPAVQLVPGQYGPLAPPAELSRYGNGRIPAEALSPVGDTGHRLWAPAATALEQLVADAAAAGVHVGITDAYRDFADQERLASELGLYSQGGLAAVPGSSTHGWGLSIDLDLDALAQAWMQQNGARYGFVEDVPREPWHWTYRPAG